MVSLGRPINNKYAIHVQFSSCVPPREIVPTQNIPKEVPGSARTTTFIEMQNKNYVSLDIMVTFNM